MTGPIPSALADGSAVSVFAPALLGSVGTPVGGKVRPVGATPGPGVSGLFPTVMGAKVREVTFGGTDFIPIVADPGTPTYPDPPHWKDSDLDGTTNDDPDAPDDRALPVAWPRDRSATVSARFTAQIANVPYPWPGQYKVRGFNTLSAAQPYYFTVPATTVSWEGNDLVLTTTTITNPFPSTMNYGSLFINWQFSRDGGSNWSDAGRSENELYVTLETPTTSPIYHTPIHLSVPSSAAVAAADVDTLVHQTWYTFGTLRIRTKHAKASVNGRPLTYYDQWDTKAGNMVPLLQGLDGQCGGFAELFYESLKSAGVPAASVEPFQVKSAANDIMMIKKWLFTGEGTVSVNLNNRTYKYQNTLADPTKDPYVQAGVGSYTKKDVATGLWEYYWGTAVEVSDQLGLPGQNTDNPKAHFSDHWLVKIAGKYYDPSYGKKFDSLQEWEDGSVAGFFTRDGANNNYRLVFRTDPPGPEIVTIPPGK